MEKTLLKTTPKAFKYLDSMSDLLDSRFRIPGTDIRFGLDFLVGLVPYAGDLVTFAFSGVLVVSMARNGASGMVLLKMLGNILLDALVGSIPLLGDLFDLSFKANRRNYKLLKEHYHEGKHGGSGIPIILTLIFALLLMSALVIFMAFQMLNWTAEFIQQLL
ncbi:MAG: DUF4112 domain-containing protein [Saprospiraceae bacterium]|nr:DUF4112 domain-containing protein [Saprospiraceae bacterium]